MTIDHTFGSTGQYVKGNWIYLVHFPPFLKEIMISCLHSCTPGPFWKRVYTERKEFAPEGSKFFPFSVDPVLAGRQNSFDEFSPLYVMYTERKKKRRVNFIPKFHSSLKKFVKYFTMITKRYMYGTKVPNFIGLWSTSLELLKFIGSYPPNLEIKIKLKINIGCAPLLLSLLP